MKLTKSVQLARAVSSAFLMLILVGAAGPVQAAATLSELRAQQAALQQQIKDAQAAAAARKVTAANAAAEIADLQKEITQVNAEISATQSTITDTESSISTLAQQITDKQAEYDRLTEQVKDTLRQYMMVQTSRQDLNYLSLVFSSDSLSSDVTTKRSYVSIKQKLERLQADLVAAQNDLKNQKEDQEQKKSDLQYYVQQNQLQKTQLAKQQATQASLKASAELAQKALEKQAASASAQIAKIEQQISLLSATKAWGNQIVSSNDWSWYYTQTGDGTYLGKSPYTVSQYGCLITSIAMVSTYYGSSVTPDYIARNGSFSSGGYLISLPPLNISVQGSQRVNWSTVNDEISNGRPVIVSIYLPSVGAVNSDGSSHFVVIKGYANGQYLMHDPIGAGRGYNLNQVVSMKLVRKN